MKIITKFKSKRKASRSKKMAKQKTKSKNRRSFSRSRGNFVRKIPVVGKIVSDRRVQKGLAASGTVSLLTGLAQLIPNQGIRNVANNPLVKTGAAFAIGDVEGAAFQTVENAGGFGNLFNRVQSQGLSGIFGGTNSSNMIVQTNGGL